MMIHYSGRVQGVGFRYQTHRVAAGFEVTGTVRNLPNGRVELVAEGDKIACLVDVVAKTPKGEGFMKALTLFTFSGGRIANELVIVDRGMPGA